MLFTRYHVNGFASAFELHIYVQYLSTKPESNFEQLHGVFEITASFLVYCQYQFYVPANLSIQENRQLRNNVGSLQEMCLQKNLKRSVFHQGIVPNMQWKVAESAV